MVETARHSVGPVSLAVLESGRGGRPLLLVHGFTGAKEDFEDWMEAFAAEGWWAVAPDLRGHGASDKPSTEDDYSLATFATDVLALADGLGWDRFALLGHSMGGAIAQEVVLRSPERVERLVLMNTHHAAFGDLDPSIVAEGVEIIRRDGLPDLIALLDAFAGPRAEADQRVRDTRPGYSEWNQTKLDVVAPAMYAALAMELCSRTDRLPELAGIAVPTLVLVGDQDLPHVGAAARMGEAIPGATHVVVPDAAHSPQFENPDAWWAAIRSFLDADVRDSLVE